MNNNQLPEGLKEKIGSYLLDCVARSINKDGIFISSVESNAPINKGAELALEWMAEQQPVWGNVSLYPLPTPACYQRRETNYVLEPARYNELTAAIKCNYFPLYAAQPINPDFSNDIDTIGNCANCGVEFHIHKERSSSPIPSNVLVDKMAEVLREAHIYLSEAAYEQGKPVYRNSIGAYSLIHKNIEEALNEYQSLKQK